MSGAPRRLVAVLASPRLAAGLIVAVCVLVLLSLVIPQSSYLRPEEMERFRDAAPALAPALDRLGLTRIFSSWIAVVVASLLAVNTAACTLRRLTRRLRTLRSLRVPPAAEDLPAVLAEAGEVLRAERWSLVSADGRGVRAVKGLSGFWGSMLLHVGILVVVLAGALSSLTSFQGELVITEGQTVTDAPSSYERLVRKPPVGDPFTGTRLTLRSMDVRYEDGERTSVLARMRADETSGRTIERDVRVNQPLDAAGTTYLLENSGYAPSIALREGDTIERRVVNLSEKTSRGWRDRLRLREVRAGGGETSLDMLASNVPLAPGQRLPVESLDIRDPRLTVELSDARGVIARSVLAPGQTARLGTVEVTFEELLLWTRFMVRRTPTRDLLYLGFWLCVAGVAWRLAVPERRLSLSLDEDGRASIRVRAWPLDTRLGRDQALFDRLGIRDESAEEGS